MAFTEYSRIFGKEMYCILKEEFCIGSHTHGLNICTHSGMRLASVLLPSTESEVTSASRAPSPILRPFLHRSTWRAEIESPFAVRKRELDKLDKPTLVSSSVLPFPTFGERIVIRNVMTYLEKQSFRWFYPKYTVLAIA